MGTAKHPHDAKRPESQAVVRALAADDMEALHAALSVRQRRFAEEYCIDFNATAACMRAGYAHAWADRQGHILLHHKGVARYIDHITQSKAAKLMSIDPDYVINKVVSIVTKEDAKDGDKLRGLELLARHLGMFIDRTEISGPDGEAIQMEQRTREEANSFITNLRLIRERNEEKKAVND